MSGARRTGVLGGTFDPIHLGHVDAAEAARAALQLDSVLVVPTHVPPHRTVQPRASTYHRFAMVALAAASRPGLLASDIELRFPGSSYTSATLQRLARLGYAPAQLFFIAGADAFAEIETWKDYPTLLDRAHFAVISRPGHPVSDLPARLPGLAHRMIQVPAAALPLTASILLIDAQTADVSSTEIRRRVAAGEPLAGLLPSEVVGHIQRHALYTPASLAANDLHE